MGSKTRENQESMKNFKNIYFKEQKGKLRYVGFPNLFILSLLPGVFTTHCINKRKTKNKTKTDEIEVENNNLNKVLLRALSCKRE